MGGTNHNPYKIPPMDLSGLPENMTGLLGMVPGLNQGTETACNSEEFIVRHVIGPAIEATLTSYFEYCAPKSENFISDNWYLCSVDHSFNCDNIRNYTENCKMYRDGTYIHPSTPSPGPEQEAMFSGTRIVLAVVALVIGIIIGVVLTIVICLACPGTYRWANKKIGKKVFFADSTRQQSVVSDYYAAIDDRHNQHNIQLHQVPNATSASNEQYLGFQRDHDVITLTDSGIQEEIRPPAPDPVSATSRLDHQESCDYSSDTYEAISRDRPYNQSHNYDRITPTTPLSPVESEHSYFVLEKTPEAT